MKNFFFFLCFFLLKNVFAQDTDNVNHDITSLQDKFVQESVYAKKVEVLKKIGEIQTKQDIKSSKKTFKKLFDLAVAEKDTVTMSQSLVELMWRNISEYNTNDALDNASEMEALIKGKKDSDNFYLAKASSTKGYAHIILGEFDKALQNSLEANELFKKIKNKEPYNIKYDLISNYLTIATVYQYTDNYDKAMKSINIALELFQEDAELKKLLGKSYNIKGDIYLAKEDFKESLVYYKKGLDFFANEKDSVNISISLKRIGAFYNKQKDFKKSLKYYKDALAICKKINRKDLMSYLYTTLGVSYGKLRNNATAIKYIDSSLAVSKDFNHVYMRMDALQNKAIIYKNEKRYDLSIGILENILTLLENSEDYKRTAMITHKLLANIYKEKKQIKKSTANFEKYIKLKEELIEKKANEKTKILEVEYNYRNIAAKLEKKEIALQLSTIKQKRFKTNTYLIIISAILLFSFIAFIVLKQRKYAKTERLILESKQELLKVKKEALDKEVEFKSKNITDFALQINEKNELLEKIKIQLKEIKPANNYSKDILLETMLFVNDDINQNKEKIQLYSKVHENNDDFESKINEQFHNLTDKERKVATMVRIGKTSKQIATQLNISVASVDNYRYTIRKKMKVPKGESLGTFIKNI